MALRLGRGASRQQQVGLAAGRRALHVERLPRGRRGEGLQLRARRGHADEGVEPLVRREPQRQWQLRPQGFHVGHAQACGDGPSPGAAASGASTIRGCSPAYRLLAV